MTWEVLAGGGLVEKRGVRVVVRIHVAKPSPGSQVGEVAGDCHEGIITGGQD